MNHRWKDNVCLKCGIARERGTSKLLMAISNHPPYNHYLYESVWFYSGANMEKKTTIRPECSIELQEDKRSVARDDDSSTKADYINNNEYERGGE